MVNVSAYHAIYHDDPSNDWGQNVDVAYCGYCGYRVVKNSDGVVMEQCSHYYCDMPDEGRRGSAVYISDDAED